jgi:hypothetical protein
VYPIVSSVIFARYEVVFESDQRPFFNSTTCRRRALTTIVVSHRASPADLHHGDLCILHEEDEGEGARSTRQAERRGKSSRPKPSRNAPSDDGSYFKSLFRAEHRFDALVLIHRLPNYAEAGLFREAESA